MASVKIPHDLGFSGGGSKRPARVADAISRELAMFFIAGVKDPRLQGLVITHAEVSKDLRRAIIFYACAEEKAAETRSRSCKRQRFSAQSSGFGTWSAFCAGACFQARSCLGADGGNRSSAERGCEAG